MKKERLTTVLSRLKRKQINACLRLNLRRYCIFPNCVAPTHNNSLTIERTSGVVGYPPLPHTPLRHLTFSTHLEKENPFFKSQPFPLWRTFSLPLLLTTNEKWRKNALPGFADFLPRTNDATVACGTAIFMSAIIISWFLYLHFLFESLGFTGFSSCQ